jgi:hypothetical protein
MFSVRTQPPFAADVGIFAIDGDDIAENDVSALIGRADIEQRLPGT